MRINSALLIFIHLSFLFLVCLHSNLETLGTNKLNTDNHISKVVLNANNNGVTFTIDGVPYTSPIMVAGKSITRMEIDTTLSKLTLSFFYDGQIIKRYVSLSVAKTCIPIANNLFVD